jgi:hypothetical protein
MWWVVDLLFFSRSKTVDKSCILPKATAVAAGMKKA